MTKHFMAPQISKSMRKAIQEISALHIFSDEQGIAPLKGAQNVPDIEVDPKTGVILGLKNNKHKLIFLGNVLDHGPFELQTLRSMVDMAFNNKATLLCGARDIEKIRIQSELTISMTRKNARIAFQDVGEIVEFVSTIEISKLKYTFIDRSKGSIFQNEEIEKVTNEDYTKTRVSQLYEKVLGHTRAISNLMSELDCMGILDKNDPALLGKHHILVCLVHCFLAGGMINAPMKQKNKKQGMRQDSRHASDNNDLNGLYLKYLRLAKLVTFEEVGEKRVLVTQKCIPHTFNQPFNPDIDSLIPYIDLINTEIRVRVEQLYKRPGVMDDVIAAELEYHIGNVATNVETISESPILSLQTWYFKGHQRVMEDTNAQAIDVTKGKGVLDFVVFSHMAQGPAPTVWSNNTNTTFVCIDVSKAYVRTKGPFASNLQNCANYAVMTVRNNGEVDIMGRAQLEGRLNPTDSFVSYTNTLKDYKKYQSNRQLDMGFNYKFEYNEYPLYHKRIASKDHYYTPKSKGLRREAMMKHFLSMASRIIIIKSNEIEASSSQEFDYDRLVFSLVDHVRSISGNNHFFLGIDGSPPGSITANIVSRVVKYLDAIVIGVINLQHVDSEYCHPSKYQFSKPLVTIVVSNSHYDNNKIPEYVYKVISIYNNDFKEANRIPIKTWNEILDKKPKHFVALWDTDMAKAASESWENSNVKNMINACDENDLSVQLFVSQRGYDVDGYDSRKSITAFENALKSRKQSHRVVIPLLCGILFFAISLPR
jgi:hypothetical protein